MDYNRQGGHQRQHEFLGLLKKYKAANCELASTSLHHSSKNSSSNQPPFSRYNRAMTSSHQFKSYPYNTSNQSYVRNQRTVLYNSKNSKYKLTANKTVKSSSLNAAKVPVASSTFANQCKQPDSCSRNSSKEVSKLSSTASISTKSESLYLLKAIESMTKMLKKKTGNESKSVRDGSSVENTLHDCRNIRGNLKYCAINKPNVLRNESKFSKINGPFKNEFKTINNVNATIGLKKNSNDCNKPNFASVQKNKYISTNSNSLNLNKYCYKKVNSEKLSSSKVAYTSLKSVYATNGNKLNDDNQKSISQSCIQKISVPNVTSVVEGISCGTKFEIKPLSEGKLKQAVATSRVMSRTKINNVYPEVHKSWNIHKLSSLAKINGLNNKYKRVNGDHSVILSKNCRLKRTSHLISPSMKKGKLNTKFKKINKNVSCMNKKMILEKNSLRCKENPPMTFEKSVNKLIYDCTVDKIEEDLLAVKSTLTSTPAKIYHKGFQNKTKMDPKLNHKQMSLKKSKTTISKYKVINSVVAHSSATNNKQNFTNLKNIKKTKFSLINKNISDTPVQKGRSVLIKRLFKSRNAIINKNASSTHHSAKMIKFKYFARNKKKLPFEKPILYSKGLFLKPKFKGYLPSKLYSKKSRPQKASIASYSQSKIRRKFSPYVRSTCTALINSRVTGSNSKKKLQRRYGQPPVVYIRGLRYSLNSSGKTLRKLPVQDFSKIHQRMAFSTKRFPKTPENRIKALTPTSANLASRVLHRSITRVLSASSKKKLIKVNSYCMFYNRFGRCNRGVKCTYIHDPSKIAVCTRFLRGTCKVDGCPFSHEITPGKMAICSFFLVGACDKDDCPYRHENLSPDAELCKAFVQGYCPSGKECKKAHVLICPKYIQGNCDKGTSCAFPHPPQKGKRNVQKETDEENKPDDALFEKVARYFQPNENASLYCEKRQDDNAVFNVVVPKQRRLEEQPSFIPLSDSSRLE